MVHHLSTPGAPSAWILGAAVLQWPFSLSGEAPSAAEGGAAQERTAQKGSEEGWPVDGGTADRGPGEEGGAAQEGAALVGKAGGGAVEGRTGGWGQDASGAGELPSEAEGQAKDWEGSLLAALQSSLSANEVCA